MSDQARNLNAHAAATFARIKWSAEYAEQRGGTMDFWDGLDASRKRQAIEASDAIRDARPYTGRRT